MSRALPWLEFAGIEVAAAHRTLTYLRRGLGCPGIDVGTTSTYAESGYEDLYEDVYEASPFDVRNLACYCDSLPTGAFVSPAADPAPWYSASRTESGDFLGYLIDSFDIGDTVTRDSTSRAGRGAVLGRTNLKGRVVEISGVMFASTDDAMRYGERWLTNTLLTVEECGTADLRLLPACGDDQFRDLIATGLVDGPIFTQLTDAPDGCLQRFSFTLLAGGPYLLADEVVELPLQHFVGGATVSVTVDGGVVGATAAKVTFSAGAGLPVTGVQIKATPTSGACPTADTADTITYTIPTLDAGTALVIDAGDRTVLATDSAGDPAGGLDLFTLTGQFEWIEVPVGETWCIQITAAVVNPTTKAEVTSRGLEL